MHIWFYAISKDVATISLFEFSHEFVYSLYNFIIFYSLEGSDCIMANNIIKLNQFNTRFTSNILIWELLIKYYNFIWLRLSRTYFFFTKQQQSTNNLIDDNFSLNSNNSLIINQLESINRISLESSRTVRSVGVVIRSIFVLGVGLPLVGHLTHLFGHLRKTSRMSHAHARASHVHYPWKNMRCLVRMQNGCWSSSKIRGSKK